jgi:hypothetical protein
LFGIGNFHIRVEFNNYRGKILNGITGDLFYTGSSLSLASQWAWQSDFPCPQVKFLDVPHSRRFVGERYQENFLSATIISHHSCQRDDHGDDEYGRFIIYRPTAGFKFFEYVFHDVKGC